MNFSDYWPRQTLMTCERCTAPVNHWHYFLLIYGFEPGDKTAGDGLSDKLRGQATKKNSSCFLTDFLLKNMKQIHQRQNHQFNRLYLVTERTPKNPHFFQNQHPNNYRFYFCSLLYCVLRYLLLCGCWVEVGLSPGHKVSFCPTPAGYNHYRDATKHINQKYNF